MNQEGKTFWSAISLKKKAELWSSDQIRNFFVPFLDLKPNEQIYDIGAGFSPLGLNFIPYILPNGSIRGFDISQTIVDEANAYTQKRNLSKQISYTQGDVYEIDERDLPLVDLVMCQQLLVNLPDPVTALEHMLNVIKSTGRIFCVENINFGAYVYRPDFSWKTNLKLSIIWQQLCIAGKFGYDHGDTTFGANLPQVFHELGLFDISWQIISSGINLKPPYTAEFKKAYLDNYAEEKERIKDLIINSWASNTNLSKTKVKFFIEQMITNDYDKYAIKNDLFLTQWYYPFMAIVGWLEKRDKMSFSENITLEI